MTAQPITGLGSEAIPSCHTNQSQAQEEMLSQHAMHLNTPHKKACRSSENEEGEGKDFSGSLS